MLQLLIFVIVGELNVLVLRSKLKTQFTLLVEHLLSHRYFHGTDAQTVLVVWVNGNGGGRGRRGSGRRGSGRRGSGRRGDPSPSRATERRGGRRPGRPTAWPLASQAPPWWSRPMEGTRSAPTAGIL